uniref:Uncharacterized protein n=1 Tax=Parascaris equorum TaxID=6256 RepID=A0A914S2T3_PAREQ
MCKRDDSRCPSEISISAASRKDVTKPATSSLTACRTQ